MSGYTIITENDISQWDDETGIKYHFPSRYLKYLTPGTKVIYYKGRMTDRKFISKRLSKEAHYFGVGVIGSISKEENTKNYFATILNYTLFEKPVLIRHNNVNIEIIPVNRQNNYWRDGVREITKEVYDQIYKLSGIENEENKYELQINDELYTSYLEGEKRIVYSTKYERNKKLRDEAIRLHGYNCMVCGLNFGVRYGDWGIGFIHVHHLKPISQVNSLSEVDPKTDLVVVCPNCHSMIHRKKDKLLSINELKNLIK